MKTTLIAAAMVAAAFAVTPAMGQDTMRGADAHHQDNMHRETATTHHEMREERHEAGEKRDMREDRHEMRDDDRGMHHRGHHYGRHHWRQHHRHHRHHRM